MKSVSADIHRKLSVGFSEFYEAWKEAQRVGTNISRQIPQLYAVDIRILCQHDRGHVYARDIGLHGVGCSIVPIICFVVEGSGSVHIYKWGTALFAVAQARVILRTAPDTALDI